MGRERGNGMCSNNEGNKWYEQRYTYRLTLTIKLTLTMGAWKKCKTILVYRQALHNSSKQMVNKEKRPSDISYKSNWTNEKTKGSRVEVHKD